MDISQIEQEIKNGDYHCYYDPNVIIEGIRSLKTLDKEKLKIVSESSKIIQQVDKNLTSVKDREVNRLGLILVESIIFDKYDDYIKELTNEELITLSYFCYTQQLNDFEDTIKLLNKNILCAICNKYDSYYYREILMTVVENEVEQNNLKDEDEIIAYISSISEDELKRCHLKYINEGATVAMSMIS